MANTRLIKQIENLEIKIYDCFILLATNVAQIRSFNVLGANAFHDCNVAIEKCKTDAYEAKQTFASKQNIDAIDENYLVPIIYNLNTLSLDELKMKKYRSNCIKICRKIATFLRKYLILIENRRDVD